MGGRRSGLAASPERHSGAPGSRLERAPDRSVRRRRLLARPPHYYWGQSGEFWDGKIERNRERDQRVNETLAAKGWTVIRIWDFEVERDLASCVQPSSQSGAPLSELAFVPPTPHLPCERE